jgi:DNA adenine methylase
MCEPFAGGAGAALRLLLDEYVEEIILNDLEPGVAAFWRATFRHTEELASLIETADVSIDEWHQQRAVALDGKGDDLALGYATFYMNRTNRSGILGARPIGGLSQNGSWKIDARFNRQQLASRVRRLGSYRNRVTILEEDGVDVARRSLAPEVLIYADPPYLVRGSGLYLNAMVWADHEALAKVLRSSEMPWIVTYDHDPRIVQLYPETARAEYGWAHTAAIAHAGHEYALFSDGLRHADLELLGHGARWC